MCCNGENPNPANPSNGGNAPCNDPTGKCPCRPISGVEVISLDYASGHNLLKNETARWTNTGTVYTKPEWLKGRGQQSPISHTMDKPVKIKATLKVSPADACSEPGTLECAGGGLNFNLAGITYKAGDNQFEIQSSNNLPKKVQKLNFNLDWKAKPTSGTFSSTTQNELFVTIDTPINAGKQEDGVTYRRMAKAVELVGAINSTDPHTIVAELMKKFPFYTLEKNLSVPAEYNHPTYFNGSGGLPDVGGAWGMADYMTQTAECQAIVRFVHGVINQVGLPGETKLMMVWADPDVSNGTVAVEQENGYGLNSKTKTVAGKTWYCALSDVKPTVGKIYSSDGNAPNYMGMNNFEACLKFTYNGVSKYYGGGAGVFNSKDEVLKAFQALVWWSDAGTDLSNPSQPVQKYKLEQIVRRYN